MALKVGSKSLEIQLCVYDCRNTYCNGWFMVNFTKDAGDFEQRDWCLLEGPPPFRGQASSSNSRYLRFHPS